MHVMVVANAIKRLATTILIINFDNDKNQQLRLYHSIPSFSHIHVRSKIGAYFFYRNFTGSYSNKWSPITVTRN